MVRGDCTEYIIKVQYVVHTLVCVVPQVHLYICKTSTSDTRCQECSSLQLLLIRLLYVECIVLVAILSSLQAQLVSLLGDCCCSTAAAAAAAAAAALLLLLPHLIRT